MSTVTGQIVSLVTGPAHARTFDIAIAPSDRVAGLPDRVRVTWRAPYGTTQAVAAVVPGQIWRMPLHLRAPRATVNFHGPDIEGRWFGQNVRVMGSVRGRPEQIGNRPWASASVVLARMRQSLRDGMMRTLGTQPLGGVIVALALGDQSAIRSPDREVFNRAGLAHLIAISGLHIGLVSGLAAALVGGGYRRLRWRGRHCSESVPAQVVMAIAACATAALYCSLAGWGIPARRVFVMLCVVACAICLRRPVHASRVLPMAALCVVLWDPWAPVALGFWLSFAAVGLLMVLAGQPSDDGSMRATVGAESASHSSSASASHSSSALASRTLSASASRTSPASASRTSPASARSRLAGQSRMSKLAQALLGTGVRLQSPSSDDLLDYEPASRTPLQRCQDWLIQYWPRLRQMAGQGMRVQLGLTLAMAPLLAVSVGQVSWVSPVVNAFAIPLVGLIVTPLALVCAALVGLHATLPLPVFDWTAAVLGMLAHGVLEQVMRCARWLSAPSWAVLHIPQLPWHVLLLAGIGVVWALLPRGAPGRRLGWLTLAPLGLWSPSTPPDGAWDAVALDIGQGTAVMVLTRQHVVVVDTGPLFEQDDAGTRVIVPALRALGRSRVHRLVASHAHVDHTGGMGGLLRAVPVDEIHASFDLNAYLERMSVPATRRAFVQRRCQAGQTWTLDGVTFRYLHPPAAARFSRDQANASSCVLLVRGSHHSAIFPGDIGATQEATLAGSVGRVDLALAAHHGSRTSSSLSWVQAVRARHVIAQAGHANRFGHPSPDALARWRQTGAMFWRTDLDGAVWARSRPDGLTLTAARDVRMRYWHARLLESGEDACPG